MLLTKIVDLHDVGVLEACDGLGLAAKASRLRRSGLDLGCEHLESHQPIETDLPDLIDEARSAATQ
jgi:hypothetical protein